jgi:hypothetical protein
MSMWLVLPMTILITLLLLRVVAYSTCVFILSFFMPKLRATTITDYIVTAINILLILAIIYLNGVIFGWLFTIAVTLVVCISALVYNQLQNQV